MWYALLGLALTAAGVAYSAVSGTASPTASGLPGSGLSPQQAQQLTIANMNATGADAAFLASVNQTETNNYQYNQILFYTGVAFILYGSLKMTRIIK